MPVWDATRSRGDDDEHVILRLSAVAEAGAAVTYDVLGHVG